MGKVIGYMLWDAKNKKVGFGPEGRDWLTKAEAIKWAKPNEIVVALVEVPPKKARKAK